MVRVAVIGSPTASLRARGLRGAPRPLAHGPSGSSSAGAAASQLGDGFAPLRLENVASKVGLDFREGAFRFGVSPDPAAMTGGGLCAIDYNNDGWLDLFVVNSYSEADIGRWHTHGGLPRTTLFRNKGGRFTNVSRRSKADLAVRGQGCVAADFNGDGRTDLFVTTAGYDKLLWNNGNGTFTEGARAAGIRAYGWHTGAAVGDVNGDGRRPPRRWLHRRQRPRSRLHRRLPQQRRRHARPPLSERGPRQARPLEVPGGRGAGRPRVGPLRSQPGRRVLRLQRRRPPRPLRGQRRRSESPLRERRVAGGKRADPAGLGFRFEERAASAGVADPNAGMGVAPGDFSGDGLTDLFVSNSRGEGHAVYLGRPPVAGGSSFTDVRAAFGPAFGGSFTGWGAAWVDLDLDTDLDLVLANGAIPVTNLTKDAEPIQVLENRTAEGAPGQFVDGSGLIGVGGLPRAVGRGLVVGDFSNDGTPDIAVNTIGGRLQLLRSTGAHGHWLEVRLAKFSPGAVVTAVLPDGRRLVRKAQIGSSYLSSQDPRLLFGLGAATTVAELDVRYPGGAETHLADLPADRIVTVRSPHTVASRRTASPTSYLIPGCTRADLNGRSVARVWDEAMLDAIGATFRLRPTHARNLFHVSAAMWDAWAAYDPKADGYFVTEKHHAADVLAAREAAISFAAYRILLWRYGYAANIRATFDELVRTMQSLCYRIDFTNTKGNSPAALGNRIAAAVIRYGERDGALESRHYIDESYTPVNAPLVVASTGTGMHDPHPLAAACARPDRGAERACRPRESTELRRRAVGARARIRTAALEEGPADQRGPAADRDAGRRGVQASGRRRHPQERPARSGRRADDRHRPGRDGRQPARDERRARVSPESRHGQAVRARECFPSRLRPGSGRVLGRRAQLGDAARSLERDREPGVRLAAVGSSDRPGCC